MVYSAACPTRVDTTALATALLASAAADIGYMQRRLQEDVSVLTAKVAAARAAVDAASRSADAAAEATRAAEQRVSALVATKKSLTRQMHHELTGAPLEPIAEEDGPKHEATATATATASTAATPSKGAAATPASSATASASHSPVSGTTFSFAMPTTPAGPAPAAAATVATTPGAGAGAGAAAAPTPTPNRQRASSSTPGAATTTATPHAVPPTPATAATLKRYGAQLSALDEEIAAASSAWKSAVWASTLEAVRVDELHTVAQALMAQLVEVTDTVERTKAQLLERVWVTLGRAWQAQRR